MDLYIQKLKTTAFPWLKKKYPGLRLKFLVDFTEQFDKPLFKGREGYQERRPRGPFLINDKDIRQCIDESFNNLGSPAQSKRSLYFGLLMLNRVIKSEASSDNLAFSDDKGAHEILNHYEGVRSNLLSLGKCLKAAVSKERIDKEDLLGSEEAARRQKVKEGISGWAKSEDRLQWHKEIDEEYIKCKNINSYVCSSKFISKAAKYGPAEITLQTPFRAGVAHQMPWKALSQAKDCFNPYIYSADDEVEDIEDGDGNVVTTQKDWSSPPIGKRCECQMLDIPGPCTCGLGAVPEGVTTGLYWDKTNSENRHIFFNYPLFASLSKLQTVRDQYFSIKLPRGPIKRKSERELDWFKGSTQFFLDRSGAPVQRVNLEHFSGYCGVVAKPGDLRKIYTTELGDHKKRVVRENESLVADHSEVIFREHYNIEAARTTQTLVTALQDRRDTIGPLVALDLPTQASVGVDRMTRIDNLKKDAIQEQANKDKKSGLKDPLSRELRKKFVRIALEHDLQWIERRNRMSKLSWQKYTFRMLCSGSGKGREMRECVKVIFTENEDLIVEYIIHKCRLKLRKGMEVTEIDKDGIVQLVIWMYRASGKFTMHLNDFQ